MVNIKNRKQNGFTAVEGLLIALIFAVISFGGYYVWRTKQQTDKSLDQSASTSQTAASIKSSQHYINLTEWGVRAPYNGPLSLGYDIGTGSDNNTATFSSKELTNADVDCLGNGGWISRGTGSESASDLGGEGQTITQYAATLDKSTYGHVGNYYYFFVHSQSACGANPDTTLNLQKQTNDAAKSLTSKLEAIPK